MNRNHSHTAKWSSMDKTNKAHIDRNGRLVIAVRSYLLQSEYINLTLDRVIPKKREL